jgi:dimethylamine monooxygenase subunit A
MAHAPLPLLDRITQQEFAFTLRGWKEPAAQFFTPSAEHGEILAERRRWLRDDPSRYLLHTPGSEGLLREALDLAHAFDSAFIPPINASPAEMLRTLGEHWEADFILCRRDPGGRMCMAAGAVCFPSHWAPETRLNLPVEALHDPVPGLNAAIGGQIHNLLDRLPSGYAWLRLNWGLSASPERNQHPSRSLPRLTKNTPIQSIWLRMEHQALVRLPRTQGILFGIRLLSCSLQALPDQPKAAHSVAGQLRSMPEAVRVYKGIQDVANQVADWLETPAS